MHETTQGMGSVPTRPRLLPVFAADDAPLVTELLFRIGTRGEFPDHPPYDGVMVAITPNALSDPQWLAEIAAHQQDHLVPVAFGTLKAHAPAAVAELNWIPLDAQDLDRTADLVVLATRSDVARHRLRRGLEADAKVWALSGRPSSALIQDLARVRKLDDAIATGDPLAQPSGIGTQFLEASRTVARRTHRKRIRSVIYRIVGALTVAALFVGAVVSARAALTAQKVSYFTADMGSSAGVPDFSAMRATAALVDASDTKIAASPLAGQAIELLSRDWPLGAILTSAARPANSAALLGRDPVSVNGDGTIAFWDANATTRHTYQISRDPLFVAAADGDATVLASTTNTLYRVATDGKITGQWPVPFEAAHLAASHDGQILAAASETTTFIAGSHAQPQQYAHVLALVPAATSVLALVADNTKISLVDLASGKTIQSWSHPWGELVVLASGDFDTDLGVGYIAGPARQLWRLGADQSVEPTGLPTTINPASVKVSPQGWVFVAAKDNGVTMLLPVQRVDMGRVCPMIENPKVVVTSTDGSRVMCGNSIYWSLHDTTLWGPHQEEAKTTAAAAKPTTPVYLTQVRQVSGTTMLIASDGSARTWAGPTTASALGPRGTAVVATDGGLAQVEATSKTLRIAWIGVAPGGEAITGITWDGDAVVLTTADGLRWERRACPGCLTSQALVAAVAARETRCFDAADIQNMPERQLRVLHIHTCPPREPSSGEG